MTTSIQAKRPENQLSYEIRQAWQSTKDRVSDYVTNFSLKDLCYGVGVVLSGLCVIYARKGKTITAVVLAVLTEVAMYKGTANKITQVASNLGIQEIPLPLVSLEREVESTSSPIIHPQIQVAPQVIVEESVSSSSCAAVSPEVSVSEILEQSVPSVDVPAQKITPLPPLSLQERVLVERLASQRQEEDDWNFPAWVAFIAATVSVVCGRR
jgi:hypothetical protein